MDETLFDSLQPTQIICLEHEQQRLYVEIIQILRDRQLGWLRPLCFCTPTHLAHLQDNRTLSLFIYDKAYILQDMRQSSDLIWPLTQCRVVLDTEAIPILAKLGPVCHYSLAEGRSVRIILNNFIHEIWKDSSNSSSMN